MVPLAVEIISFICIHSRISVSSMLCIHHTRVDQIYLWLETKKIPPTHPRSSYGARKPLASGSIRTGGRFTNQIQISERRKKGTIKVRTLPLNVVLCDVFFGSFGDVVCFLWYMYIYTLGVLFLI